MNPHQATGMISGRLEAVSIHREHKFTLYPPLEGEEVDCIFQPGDLEKVLLALGKNVTVHGMLYYSKSKSFPVRVKVRSYEVMPEADDLPTLLDLRGALKTKAKARRNVRDEWN